MDEIREENPTMCERVVEEGDCLISETRRKLKRNEPYLFQDGERTALLVIHNVVQCVYV